MQKTSLDFATAVCKTMIKKYAAKDLPPVGKFHYHQGVFLSGMQKIYKLTGEKTYYMYIKEWVDSLVDENGYFPVAAEDELDDYQPAILLFDLYQETKEEKYKRALERTVNLIKKQSCNQYGGFWHKHHRVNEMWLDGMYMAGPFMAEYGSNFKYESFYDVVHLQMSLMHEHNRDGKTGLYYHAWKALGEADWANPVTGCSPEFWGRAIGWFVTAMFDIAEKLPETYEKRDDFISVGIELIDSLLKYQDKTTGLWYQVIDKGHISRNWHEVSCSCLILHAICKAIRMGYLDEAYKVHAQKAYDGIIATLGYDGEDVLVQKVCIGTGICTFQQYIDRPTSTNDLHGVGAFLLMCSEYYRAMGE